MGWLRHDRELVKTITRFEVWHLYRHGRFCLDSLLSLFMTMVAITCVASLTAADLSVSGLQNNLNVSVGRRLLTDDAWGGIDDGVMVGLHYAIRRHDPVLNRSWPASIELRL